MPLEFGILCKAGLLFINIFNSNLFFDVLIIGCFRFAYLWTRLLQKSVKAGKVSQGGGILNQYMAGKPQRVGTIFYGGS